MAAFALVASVAFASAAAAQSGTVHGRVLDERGRPLPGASVQIEQTTLGDVAGADGLFAIASVPAGTHTIVARHVGFAPARRSVTVAAGATVEIEFTLGEDPLGMDEIVVSGIFHPATKLESSTAITTLTPQQIENRIPRGAADLLKAVPGLQVTSNYGETGADVTVRGLPQTANSSFRYVSLQEDGLPVFEAPGLVFAFPDAMVRTDETVGRVEVVRGGSAAVLTTSTPGGIVNFISKTGGNVLEGTLKNMAGVHGMFRQDVNLGGPLVDDWRFNAGGYYRYDAGVRFPGFPANRGGQVKANVTRITPEGFVRFYGRYMNERNVWYMGIPIQNHLSPEPIPGGPEVGRGTTFSPERLVLSMPDAFNRGAFTQRSLSDGYAVRYRMIGLEISRDLGPWNLMLRSRALQADNEMNLMADVADPFPITAFGQPGLPAQVPRFLRFVNTGETITDPSRVADLNGNGLMSVHGLAFIDQPVTNYITNLQATREVGPHRLTGGFYYSGYGTQLRIAQAGVFLEVANHPRMIQIMIPGQNGAPMGLTPADGFAGYNTGYWNLRSFTNVAAAYVGDSWTATEKLSIDGGIRLDVHHSTGAAERPVNPGRVVQGEVVGQVVPSGYPSFVPTPEQSMAGLFGSGRYRTWDYTFVNVAGSMGANYLLSDRLAVYARGSRGTRVPTVQQWTFQVTGGSQTTGETIRGEVEQIVQVEAGLKAAAQSWSLLMTGFYSHSTNMISVLHRGRPDGSFVFLPVTGDTRTVGVEIEAVTQPLGGLEFRVMTTIQDPRFVRFGYEFFVPGTNPHSGPQVRDYAGNYLNDAVRLLADLTTSYTWSAADVFVNLRYTGERMANRPNTIVIPAYTELMAGAGYRLGRMRLAVQGANLLNTQAIAQMAARTGEDVLRVHPDGTAESVVTTGPAAGTTTRGLYTTGLGILPRSVLLSAAYTF